MYKYAILFLLLTSPQGIGQCPDGKCPTRSSTYTVRYSTIPTYSTVATISIPVSTASPYLVVPPVAVENIYERTKTTRMVSRTVSRSVQNSRLYDPVSYHDYLHNGYWGGPRWTYPGEINNHLRQGHGIR